ncbi:MAG: YbjQ family protein [Candidatus Hydrothermarchaeota archaeon]
MILTNTESIPGFKIKEIIGLVQGNSIRAVHLGKDILAGLRNIVGGELIEYEEMMDQTRKKALQKMIKEAESLGADAIINVRFSSSVVTTRAAEIIAYGTAVKIE